VSSATRSARYGFDRSTFVRTANAGVVVLVVVESATGVENIEEIVAVPGLDGVLVGGDDLSSDYGIPGQYDHPTMTAAFESTVAAAVRAGLKIGAAHPDALLLGCANDAVMNADAARQALESRRQA
jgi:2-keto-3-deoxy-L-rhamnonate aldolase RhmA